MMVGANPGVPGLLVAPSWRTMWSVTYRRLRQTLLSGMSERELPPLVDKQAACYLDFGGGTHVFLRSAKNPESMEGIDAGWLCGDEARYWSRAAKDVAFGRVRVPCRLSQRAFSSTPAMGWLSDEFDSGLPNRTLFRAPTIENAANLQEDYVENLKLSYSRRMQKAVLEGLFTVMEGAVYEDFDPSRGSPWFMDYDHERLQDQDTQLWVDPGYRRASFLWVRKLGPPKDLRWVCFHQWHPDNMALSDAVQTINGWNKANNVRLDTIWTDPASTSHDPATAISAIQVLRTVKLRPSHAPRRGIRYISGIHTNISTGVDRVRTFLGDPENGRPIRLMISNACHAQEKKTNRGLVKSLSAYSYPEIKDGRPVGDEPLKDGVYDHCCDAARYGIVGLWLSDPLLRAMDPTIGKAPGFKQN